MNIGLPEQGTVAHRIQQDTAGWGLRIVQSVLVFSRQQANPTNILLSSDPDRQALAIRSLHASVRL